jgi:hypothetical protein
MSASTTRSTPSLGFLTVIDQQESGLFGGYLILNAAGRPLEFHCTAPVKPNRAQQILYGKSLAPYLYGEQIGQALLANAKVVPHWICTDVEPVLAVRDFSELPVALLLPRDMADPETDDTRQLRFDAPHEPVAAPHAARLSSFSLGEHRLAVSPPRDADRAAVVAAWSDYAEFDLHEPFVRIREAIEEAQQAAR